MNFISISFLFFLVLVFGVYFIVPGRFRWIVLLVSSYVFYAFSALWMLVILFITTLITYGTGILLGKEIGRFESLKASSFTGMIDDEKKLKKSKHQQVKKWIMTAGLLLVFAILVGLKYGDFLALNFHHLFKFLGLKSELTAFSWLLPLGISFYTFQSAGYLIDIYREKIKPETNLARLALFVSFFPQIIQGPISRYSELAEQLFKGNEFDYTRVKFGLQLILWGYFKKLVIADRAAVLVNTIFNNHTEYHGSMLFLGAFTYCIQIYGDFSGGIDIARGVAQVLGITLPENFLRPFFAVSVADFWRRWHITLSNWMRDYIFYPLSLSRGFVQMGKFTRKVFGNSLGKKLPTVIAMWITFFLVGIWHGANWKYLMYGIYNGFFIILGMLVGPGIGHMTGKLRIRESNPAWKGFQILVTLVIIVMGRFFSRAPTLSIAMEMFGNVFDTFNPQTLVDGSLLKLGLNLPGVIVLLISTLILITVDVVQERGLKIRECITRLPVVVRWGVYLIGVLSILVFGIYGIEYDAARFIYRGF
jgi:alginate O-acetyltransferase complex protein AlgI